MDIRNRIHTIKNRIAAKEKDGILALEPFCPAPNLSETSQDESCHGCGDMLDVDTTIYRFTTPKKVRAYCAYCGMMRRMRLVGRYKRILEPREVLARLNDPLFFQIEEAREKTDELRARLEGVLMYVRKRGDKLLRQRLMNQ
jgi:hypothetical protein